MIVNKLSFLSSILVLLVVQVDLARGCSQYGVYDVSSQLLPLYVPLRGLHDKISNLGVYRMALKSPEAQQLLLSTPISEGDLTRCRVLTKISDELIETYTQKCVDKDHRQDSELNAFTGLAQVCSILVRAASKESSIMVKAEDEQNKRYCSPYGTYEVAAKLLPHYLPLREFYERIKGMGFKGTSLDLAEDKQLLTNVVGQVSTFPNIGGTIFTCQELVPVADEMVRKYTDECVYRDHRNDERLNPYYGLTEVCRILVDKFNQSERLAEAEREPTPASSSIGQKHCSKHGISEVSLKLFPLYQSLQSFHINIKALGLYGTDLSAPNAENLLIGELLGDKFKVKKGLFRNKERKYFENALSENMSGCLKLVPVFDEMVGKYTEECVSKGHEDEKLKPFVGLNQICSFLVRKYRSGVLSKDAYELYKKQQNR